MTTYLNGLSSLIGNIHLEQSDAGLEFLRGYFGVGHSGHLAVVAAMETEVGELLNERIQSQGFAPIDTAAGFNEVFRQIFGSNSPHSSQDEHRASYTEFLKALRATSQCDFSKLRYVCDLNKSHTARLSEIDSAFNAIGVLDYYSHHVNFNVISFYCAAMRGHPFFSMPANSAARIA